MVRRAAPLAGLLLLMLAGCTTTQQHAGTDFKPPTGSYKLVVMRPDIAVSLLTAGGQLEPREDWTNTARENVLGSLRKQQSRRGGETQVALSWAEAGGSQEAAVQLNQLHEVVGQSILLHKYLPYGSLPTKKGRFDWTLGELATSYGAASGNDYALFVFARDSFSSGGRAALQAVGFLGCLVGVCMIPGGGSQAAFASLVDLKTGNVVWFNFLASSVGDIRDPKGADAMVSKLLDTMRPGGAQKKKKA
jgi:hypothetical protein